MSVLAEWRKPYRTMDVAGSPESAKSVGWAWLNERAEEMERCGSDAASLSIETGGQESDVTFAALYKGTQILYAYTVFRDQMNFAVLIRWWA